METEGVRSPPIVIVGGGPVGMMLAMNLAALGVRSLVLNTGIDSRWQPKGSTQNARTMEHYRRLGVVGRVRRVGLPPDHPTDVGYFTALNGWEMARLKMPSEADKMRRVREAPVTDQVPEPLFRCNQMYVERELHAHLQTLPAVELRFGWRCVGVADLGPHVAVEVEHVASGRRETLSCAYVVGCDGGQSIVRRTLGIRYSGDAPAEQAYGSGATVSTHLRAPSLYRRIISRHCWQYWIVSARVRSLVTALDGDSEFLFNTRCRSVDEPPNRAMIAQRFQASVGEDVEVEYIAHWPWTAGQALVADGFGRGRILLAGDAVHLFTPTGGFGMNTGIDDAANLGWKLAAMVQGWGGPKLLASYEAERRPIAFRNTGHAKRLSGSLGEVPVAPEIDDDSDAGEAARAAAAKVLSSFGEEFASIGVQLGARYDGSPIVAPDGTDAPPDDPAIYVPSACPGGRAPHVWLPDRSSLYDHFGRSFTVLRLPGCRADGRALAAAFARRDIPLAVLDVPVAEARDLYRSDMALIRPDQHVAWRGDRPPDDPDALVARVTGW
jgi:2-polyprenyl-6-methoxyphenol hydroxylase-like FAD-dependent oxidoreductase